MSKKVPSFDRIIIVIGYILGALFLGLLTMGIVEILGDAFNNLHGQPGWTTGIAALITGGALLGVYKYYSKTDDEEDE